MTNDDIEYLDETCTSLHAICRHLAHMSKDNKEIKPIIDLINELYVVICMLMERME